MPADSTSSQTSPRPLVARHPWRAAAICTLLWVLVGWVHWPNRVTFFKGDEHDHLRHWRGIQTGKEEFWPTIFTPHNVHVIPLWRLWFFGQLYVFGSQTTSWHVAMMGTQGVTATALFLLFLRWLRSWPAATFGAGLWSATAQIGFDSPLIWIAASHLSFAVAFFLPALVVASHLDDGNRRFRAALMAMLLAGSLCTMGAMLLPAVLVALVGAVAAPSRRYLLRDARLWCAGWLLPCALSAAMQAPILLSLSGPVASMKGTFSLDRALGFAVLHFGLAMETLVGLSRFPVGGAVGLIASGLAIGFCLHAGSARERIFLAAALAACFSYTLLGCYTASGWPIDRVLNWARYRYVPALFAAICVAVTAGIVLRSTPRFRHLVAVILAGWLVGFAVDQSRQVRAEARLFRRLYTIWHAELADYGEVLAALARAGRSQGRPIVLPNADVKFAGTLVISIDRIVVLLFPRGLAGVEVAEPSDYTSQDRADALAALRRLDLPGAGAFLDALHGNAD